MRNINRLNNIFVGFLIIFSIVIIGISFIKTPKITGDGTEYFMMSESLYSHYTADMKENDIINVKKKINLFSIHYPNIDEMDKHGYYLSYDKDLYSYHFFSYSLLSLPIKYILTFFEQNDFKVFQIFNSIIFIFMIWFIYIKEFFKENKNNVLILFLLFNPVVYYLNWTHPEVFTYVFVVLSLLYFQNKNYKISFIFMSIASWQNPPVLIFSIFVYLHNTFINLKERNIKDIILESFSISIALFPMIFYFYNFGVLNLIAAKGYSSFSFISFDKIYDLFFGLAHGMVLFYPFVIFVFLYLVLKKSLSKDIISYIYIFSILVMTILMTTTPNWNSGMEFVIRYSIWLYPFIIFFILNYFKQIYLKKLIYLHVFYFIFIFIFYRDFSDMKFNFLSKVILNNFPSLYITEKETFAENTFGEGVNLYTTDRDFLPILYINPQLQATKILTDFNGLGKLSKNENYNINSYWLEKTKEKYLENKEIFFINVPENNIIKKKLKLDWNKRIWKGKDLSTLTGNIENESIISNNISGVLSFGPYVKLPKGNYRFGISYSSNSDFEVGTWDVAVARRIINKGKIIANKEGYISSTFEITDVLDSEPLEIRTFFNGNGKLTIKELSIERIENE